jgi:hypothetical protein
MLSDQSIQKLMTISEIGLLEKVESANQIHQTAFSGEIQYADSAGYAESFKSRCCRTFSIVDQKQVRSESEGQRNCRLFPTVQFRKNRVLNVLSCHHLKPVRRIFHLCLNYHGRGRMTEFLGNSHRYDNSFEKLTEKVNLTDTDQITNGTRIRNHLGFHEGVHEKPYRPIPVPMPIAPSEADLLQSCSLALKIFH